MIIDINANPLRRKLFNQTQEALRNSGYVAEDLYEISELSIPGLRECYLENIALIQQAESQIHTRHLLYHIWPKKGKTQSILYNITQLKRRLHLFNGIKVLAIVTGNTEFSPDEIVRLFNNSFDKVIVLPNDKNLREVVTFIPLFNEVSNYLDGHATFYCHGKGTTHDFNEKTTVHAWSDMMFEILLDYWPYIEKLLSIYPIVGAFKKYNRLLHVSKAEWHYTGTYYWFRNDVVFKKDWRKVDQIWWGTELWPGIQFTKKEGGCAFLSGATTSINLYDLYTVVNLVFPALEHFRVEMQSYKYVL